MLRSITTVFAISLGIASVASAQTYKEELYQQGYLNLSNVEEQIAALLRDNGVPDDCLGKLEFSDVSEINGIIKSTQNTADKRMAVRQVIVEKCGEPQ